MISKINCQGEKQGVELSIMCHYLCKIEKTILHMHKITAAGNTACLQAIGLGGCGTGVGLLMITLSVFWILKEFMYSCYSKPN